ncbi:hypothetical protein APASM_1457 [Actinosynnema pretiosum subsp. pretiosum]|nr:hypothetical protein APASM_1457 [Actinosynnema pretiosum subsp. pretiosum]
MRAFGFRRTYTAATGAGGVPWCDSRRGGGGEPRPERAEARRVLAPGLRERLPGSSGNPLRDKGRPGRPPTAPTFLGVRLPGGCFWVGVSQGSCTQTVLLREPQVNTANRVRPSQLA